MAPRQIFVFVSALAVFGIALLGLSWLPAFWALFALLPLVLLGVYDMLQTKHAIRRHFPFLVAVTTREISLPSASPKEPSILR